MITLEFPKPKDPADIAWYSARSFEQVASVLSVTAGQSTRVDLGFTVAYNTPGDTLDMGDLVASDAQVNLTALTLTDGTTIPAGFGIVFRLSAGKPGLSYAVRITYVTVSGQTLSRSAILVVTGA